MQDLANALRESAQRESRERTGPNKSEQKTEPVETQQAAQIARALDRVANQLARADAMADDQSRKLASQREQAADLRERIESLTRELERLNEPRRDGRETGGDLARLRDQYARQLQEARALLDQLRREDPTLGQSGAGLTFEGQGMTLSAPGTEAFKQDFSKWMELSRQVTQTLARAESTLTRKLQAREAAARLPAAVDDQPPVEYQQQVDSYFKSIAERRQR
jgi:hypothetical protein